MSKELLLQQPQQKQQQQQQVDPDPLQHEKDGSKMLQDLEQEIECPRCYDIMVLSSNFNGLCYFCQECNLSLLIN